MARGATKHLILNITPAHATDKIIIWESSNDNIASVDTSGKIIAKSNGVVSITAKNVKSGKIAQCAVVVMEAQTISNISMKVKTKTVAVGDVLLLDYTISPQNAVGNVIWQSDNLSVATVNENGVITAKSIGEVNITVSSQNGTIKDVCKLFVDDGMPYEINAIKNFTKYGSNLVGGVTVNVNNRTTKTISAEVILAFYNQKGVLQKFMITDRILVSGNNTVETNNIYLENADTSGYRLKVMVWNKERAMEPLSGTQEILLN